MRRPERGRAPLERCWICHQRILPGDAARLLPGYDLTVHVRCYKTAIEPSAAPTAE